MASGRKAVVAYLAGADDEVVREQVAFAKIPCPDWRARERGRYLAVRLSDEGLEPRMDRVGNVIAVRPGRSRSTKARTLIVCAHIDSVFYNVREIEVVEEGSVLRAPGICDNAAGVADMILLARALRFARARTAGDVVIVGSVGEEGEGRLKGMRHFFGENRFADAWFVGVDGSGPGSITRTALASWSPKIVVRGSGGTASATSAAPTRST